MTNELIIRGLLLIVLPIGFLLGVIWMAFVFYLKYKWLRFVEDILEDGRRWYSLNIFLAGQGTLHYASIFISKFHAKRYGLLEKRDEIPKHVQRLFIVVFCLFITSFILCFGSSGIISFLKDG